MPDPRCMAVFDAACCDLLEPSVTLRERLGANACSRLWTQLAPLRAEAEHAQSVERIEALVTRCVEIFNAVPETAALLDRYRDAADRVRRGGDATIVHRSGHTVAWWPEPVAWPEL
jgi:hypothetical protein